MIRKPSGPITWPSGRDRRLGTQLLVFREIASRRETASNFGAKFITGSDALNGAGDLIKSVFMPMARELRRRFESETAGKKDIEVPAADRTVTLDHNSEPYREAVTALEVLENTIRQANDYPDAEDKEQRIAEVSAARRLLSSARVRVGAVVALLGSGITYFATHLAGTAIDRASAAVVDAFTKLIGLIF